MNRVLMSAVVAIVFGCGGSPYLPEVSQEGFHVVVATDPGLNLCAGSLAQMDEFMVRISKELSVSPVTGSKRVEFNWLDAADFASRAPCEAAFSACTRSSRVYSELAPFNHELVHAVSFAVGYPPPFFVEGLAVAYQGLRDDDQSLGPLSLEYDVRSLLEMTGVELSSVPDGYERAGAFTAFLISSFGMQEYMSAYSAMSHQAKLDDIDAVFRRVFEMDLEQAIVAFESSFSPFCGQAEFDAKLIECAAPEIAWDGKSFEQHRSLACDQDDAVGPFRGDTVVVLQTLRVSESGTYELVVVGDSAAGVFSGITLHYCGGCIPLGRFRAGVGGSPQILPLQAGLYSLRLHGSAVEQTGIGLRLRRVTQSPTGS